ncbi:MAG: ATP-binding cassette domain-containing protein [Thermodesulfovibrionales bacterium]|nr:ATP-binding cassette domain-containing protein [Thermodesulfovibrionales bacterium]
MLLEVMDMYISYNGTKAVDGISINVPEGESVGIIGPNGSGKSTFLKGIAGVTPLNGGSVILDGQDITLLTPRERLKKSIVYLPQGLDVFPSLSVEDNLKLFIAEMPNANTSLDEAYSFYSPLRDKKKKLAGNLSGGERRLLALTRAIISKPKVLLLDEPSAGLAPAMLEVVVKKIEVILKAGVTLILVEQILTIVQGLVGYLYIFNNGILYSSFSQKEFGQQNNKIKEVFLGKT